MDLAGEEGRAQRGLGCYSKENRMGFKHQSDMTGFTCLQNQSECWGDKESEGDRRGRHSMMITVIG